MENDDYRTMKILLADHSGMCFGVRDALAQAEQLSREGPLTILGELVHNPIVRARLRKQGIRESPLERVAGARTGRAMITAHGASDARKGEWRVAGVALADGTCPLVRHAHTQLKRLVGAGFHPIVIGRANHVEVLGLTGDFPEATVIAESADLAVLPIRPRYGIISQTTQRIEHVHDLVAEIREARPKAEVRFIDTVCKPTKDRQSALEKLITIAEVIVVVGGRESNNTLQLVKTAREAGRQAHHIERSDELRPEWFEAVETVGVTAGTSTLRETVEGVIAQLRFISEQRQTTTQEQT